MSIFMDKVAVITGAGSGIGRCLAIQLAEQGAQLALSDVNQAGLEETVSLLPDGTTAKSYVFDVSSWDAFTGHAAEVKNDFGSAHYIFNNAGVTVAAKINESSMADFKWLLGINLYGVIHGTKAFLPMMLEQREGCLVNISSVFGLVTVPLQGAYHVSKFGVRGLTECLWRELEGTGVRAIVVHPGGINTEIAASARDKIDEVDHDTASMHEKMAKMLTGAPEDCARGILVGVEKGKKRILVGPGARLLFFLSRWFPNSYGSIMKRLVY